MNEPPSGPTRPLEVRNIPVSDLESLQRKWSGVFTFDCPDYLEERADKSAAAIDQFIINLGPENLQERGVSNIVISEEMHVSHGILYFSILHRLAENVTYFCSRLGIQSAPAFQEGAEGTQVIPARRLFGFGPRPPAPKRTPEITEEDLFGPPESAPQEPPQVPEAPPTIPTPAIRTAEFAGVPTQVVRERSFPQEWTGVEPAHEARAKLFFPGFEGVFRIEAIGMTGCLVRMMEDVHYGDLSLTNSCRITLQIPGRAPLELEGNLTEVNRTALTVYFENVTPEQNEVLTRLNACLRGPAPKKPDLREIRSETRRRVITALGAVGVAMIASLFVANDLGPQRPEQGRPAPAGQAPQELTDDCQIRYVPETDSYRASCDITRREAIKPALRFRKRDRMAARSGVHQADVSFARGGKTCKTKEPWNVIPHQTQETRGVVFTCVESPRE